MLERHHRENENAPIALARYLNARPQNPDIHGPPTRERAELRKAVEWLNFCMDRGIPLTKQLTRELVSFEAQSVKRERQRMLDIADVNNVRSNARTGAPVSTKPKAGAADRTAFAITAKKRDSNKRSAKAVEKAYYKTLGRAARK